MSVVAQAQQAGGTALFIDAEHALDPAYAAAVGVDLGRLLVCQPDSGEHALKVLEVLVRSGALDLAVVDSVPALVPRTELDGEMGDSYTGASWPRRCPSWPAPSPRPAPPWSWSTSSATTPASCSATPRRSRVEGRSSTTPRSGWTCEFANRSRTTGGWSATASESKWLKNKVAAPFRAAGLLVRFGQGIDQAGELLDLGLACGYIKRTSAGYRFGSARLGAGHEEARRSLQEHPDLASRLHAQLTSDLPRGGQAA